MQPGKQDQKTEMDAAPDPITRQKHVKDEYAEDQWRKDPQSLSHLAGDNL